jgi:hypothetical protein
MHKMEFSSAYCKDLLNRTLKKFIWHFSKFSAFSRYFRNLIKFLEL